MLAQSTNTQIEATPKAALRAKAESLLPIITYEDRRATYDGLVAAIHAASGSLSDGVMAAVEIHGAMCAILRYQGMRAGAEITPEWAKLRGDFMRAWGLYEGSCLFTDDVVTGDLDVTAGKELHDEHEERFDDLLDQVEAYRPATVLDIADKAMLLHLTPEFDQSGLDVIARDLSALFLSDAVSRAWVAAAGAVDDAEQAFVSAAHAQYAFEDANPDVGDGDPEYERLKSKWDATNCAHSNALYELTQVQAPDAAAIARQVQAFGYLCQVTTHKIGGLEGHPMDPADPHIASAVDLAGPTDERAILGIYRSALHLANGRAPKIITPDFSAGSYASIALQAAE
ncbi:hypothetical protein [Caulobacter zeae]|nr:hypothetical protein [Caulobacter zeae]